jgi:hypothetical protein
MATVWYVACMSRKSWLAIGSLLVGWAIDMSGIQTGPLAALLMFFGLGCYCFAVWDWLKPIQIGVLPRKQKQVAPKIERQVKALFMLLLVATLALSSALYYTIFKQGDIEWASAQWLKLPKEVISGKSFLNETVSLDGKVFVNCTFNNVILSFDGTAPFEISRNANRFVGQIIIKTRNERLGIFGRLFTEMKFLAPRIIEIDDKEGFSMKGYS